MAARIAALPSTGNPPDIQELLDFGTEATGGASNVFLTLAKNPELFCRWLPFYADFYTAGRLAPRQTDHTPVDYSAIARAAGIHSIRVEKPADLRSALSDGLNHPGPALIELITDPNVLEMPPHLTGEQVRGFALASAKVVLGGGVGRMLDMARANLRYGTAAPR